MSPLEVLQLIGYSVGAGLTLWMSVLLWRQRRSLERIERVLLALAVAIGLWHASNLFITLHRLLVLDVARWSVALRLVDTVAVSSITFAYSFLLHVHLHLWARAKGRELTWFERVRVLLSYVPTVFLAVAVYHVWRGEYAPMLEKLSFFVLPFGVWAAYVLCLIAATDWLIARSAETQRERRLMQTLAVSFVGIGALLVLAYAFGLGRGTQAGHYLQTLGNLGSLLPAALIAYHIYRYRYLELVIRESLVVASFAAVVLVVYLFVIRTLAEWLTARYALRAGVMETLLVLAFALVFAPLRAWLERRFHRLFSREAALYRDVVARIGTQAGRFRQLPELLRFVEEQTERELNLRRVKFYLRPAPGVVDEDAAPGRAVNGDDGELGNREVGNGEVRDSEVDGREVDGREVGSVVGGNGDAGNVVSENAVAGNGGAGGGGGAWIESLLRVAEAEGVGLIERGPLLRAHAFVAAYPLRRDREVLGLMLVDASNEALTDDAHAVLEVLAGQVAIAIEDRRLLEENLGLERKLAQGERLAALGRMATTVAHEVKNPLSAIKSIAQVMREDERLKEEFARDLDLIVGETDRLSRSVTQMLSFARTTPPADPPARADELTRAVCDLFRAQARGRGVGVECRAEVTEALDGPRVTAVRDALSNLILNALQAAPGGGRVTVENTRGPQSIVWAVVDSGPGVSQELRARIWEPFFTTKQRGTGLGLAIVKKRIEEAGGSVRLAPQREGEGARFELRLPAAPAPE